MIIDKLNGINPLQNVAKSNAVGNKSRVIASDSVDISSDAKVMSELYQVAEQVKAAPDIRQDRIDEILAQMKENPNFFSAEKLEAVAEKLVSWISL